MTNTQKEKKRVSPFSSPAQVVPADDQQSVDDSMTLYLAGPISGQEDDNRDLFEMARFLFEKNGYQVVVPHDIVPASSEWLDAILTTLDALRHVDGVAVIGDVLMSSGTMIEMIAALRIGLPVLPSPEWILAAQHPDGPEQLCQMWANSDITNMPPIVAIDAILSGDVLP